MEIGGSPGKQPGFSWKGWGGVGVMDVGVIGNVGGMGVFGTEKKKIIDPVSVDWQ